MFQNMGPPRIPTTIAGDGVSEGSQLSASGLASLIIEGTANAGLNLIDGWNKKIVALVVISLNNLNTKVDNARILLQGTVCEGVKPKSASRFWPVADKSFALHTEAFDSSIFVFRNGLSSDYIDSADIPIRLLKNGGPVADPAAVGISGFCFRAHLQPCEPPGWANFAISFFPLSKADLLERFPYALDPAFPGMSFFKGLIELNPPSLDESDWGLPFLPGILPGSDTEDAPLAVTAKDVFNCTVALLRKAAGQELKANPTTLAKRWKELEEKGARPLLTVPPLFLWPAASPIAEISIGKAWIK